MLQKDPHKWPAQQISFGLYRLKSQHGNLIPNGPAAEDVLIQHPYCAAEAVPYKDFAGCPTLAGFARVGIFGPAPFSIPGVAEFKPPPFEIRKGWGTRCEPHKLFLSGLRVLSELFAVGFDQLDEAADVCALLRRIERHFNDVSLLYALAVPAAAHEDRRRAGLEEPVLHVAFFVLGVEADLDVRIGPQEFRYRRIDRDFFRHVI